MVNDAPYMLQSTKHFNSPPHVAFAKAQGGLTAETRRVGSQIHVKSILRHCIDAKNITD